MLRFFFRRPRTVRVPVDNRNVDIQTVKLSQSTRNNYVARLMLMGLVVAFTFDGVKSLDPLGRYRNRDLIQEQLDKARKDKGRDDSIFNSRNWDTLKTNNNAKGDKTPSTASANDLRMTLPIWIRKDMARPFTENEPEYKEFVKLQSDKKRVEDLKKKVYEVVMQSIKQNSENYVELRIIGWNGKVAGDLDVAPQLFAPPLYQVPCVIITEKPLAVNLSWRSLPPDTAVRIERIFRPLVVLDAASAAARVFISMAYAITTAKMNAVFKSNRSGTNNDGVAIEVSYSAESESEEDEQETQNSTMHSNANSNRPKPPYFPDMYPEYVMRKKHQDIVSSMPYSSAIQQAAIVFNQVKEIRQKAAVSNNVRGICQLRGNLVFYGQAGKFKMEVHAYYLPGENVFIGAIQIKQRYIVRDYAAVQKYEDQRRLNQKKRQASLDAPVEDESDQNGTETEPAAPEQANESKSTASDEEEKK